MLARCDRHSTITISARRADTHRRKTMNISRVMTIIGGEVVTATPAPRGCFWMARIQGTRAAFFGGTATEAFHKARLWIAGDSKKVAA